jgi:hypothetical protein
MALYFMSAVYVRVPANFKLVESRVDSGQLTDADPDDGKHVSVIFQRPTMLPPHG